MKNYEKEASELTKLEYALIHSAYEPSKSEIETALLREKNLNPHNEPSKPILHNYEEIKQILKVKYFKSLLEFATK